MRLRRPRFLPALVLGLLAGGAYDVLVLDLAVALVLSIAVGLALGYVVAQLHD